MKTYKNLYPQVCSWENLHLAWRKGKRVDPTKGRHGMAAEHVLRAAVLKQLCGFSYEELAFHLADSTSYHTFCRLD